MIRYFASLFLPEAHPFTVARSSKWPAVAREHLRLHPRCELCGGTKQVVPHHVFPVHAYPERELDPGNLFSLCNANSCHFLAGHLLLWSAWNPNVVEDVRDWRIKIMTRMTKGPLRPAEMEIRRQIMENDERMKREGL